MAEHEHIDDVLAREEEARRRHEAEPPITGQQTREAILETLRDLGFEARLENGLPFVPAESLPTFEEKRRLIRALGDEPRLGGLSTTIYAEGAMIVPAAVKRAVDRERAARG